VIIVEPVNIVDEFVGLSTEADRLDVQIFEAQVFRVHDQILRLNSHEFGLEPGAEHLAIE